MRKFLASVFFAMCIAAVAQTPMVLVDEYGDPVIGAAVFNSDGRIIFVTKDDGCVTTPSTDQFPLTVKSIGMKEMLVEAPADTVMLESNPISLGEIAVSPDSHPILKLTCLLKESSGLNSSKDSTKIASEYMVEFYLPMRKVKGFKAVRSPLIRNFRYEYSSTSGEPVDTLSAVRDISFMQLVFLDYKPFDENDALKGVAIGSDTVFAKKTGRPQVVTKKSPSGYLIRKDAIANEESGIFSPLIFKMLGMTMDFTEFLLQTNYETSDNGTHSEKDLTALTISMKALCRVKILKKIFGSKEDIGIYSYLELIPVDREFLTVEDAKESSRSTYTVPFPNAD